MIINQNQDFNIGYIGDTIFETYTKAADGLGNVYLSNGTDCYKFDMDTYTRVQQTQLSGKTINMIVESASGITYPTVAYTGTWRIIELSSGYTSSVVDASFLNNVTGMTYKSGVLWYSQGNGAAATTFLRYLNVNTSTVSNLNLSSVLNPSEKIAGLTNNSSNLLVFGASAFPSTNTTSSVAYRIMEIADSGSLIRQSYVNTSLFSVTSYRYEVSSPRIPNLFLFRNNYVFIGLNDICVVLDEDLEVVNQFFLPTPTSTPKTVALSSGFIAVNTTKIESVGDYIITNTSTDEYYNAPMNIVLGFFPDPKTISFFGFSSGYTTSQATAPFSLIDSFSKKAIFGRLLFNLPLYSNTEHVINSQDPLGTDISTRTFIINEVTGGVVFDEDVNAGDIPNQIPSNNEYIELSMDGSDSFDLRCFES